jgi:hypothetical protein
MTNYAGSKKGQTSRKHRYYNNFLRVRIPPSAPIQKALKMFKNERF